MSIHLPYHQDSRKIIVRNMITLAITRISLIHLQLSYQINNQYQFKQAFHPFFENNQEHSEKINCMTNRNQKAPHVGLM